MKILIAGGAGYIGSALVPHLLELGYEVDVVDLLWFGNYLPKQVKILKKDIFSLVEQEIEGYDEVIFLAGLSNDPMAEFSPSLNFICNGAAPAYLGYIAKRVGVKRLVYAGSCSVYGHTLNQLYDEESPAISNYPYGISKMQGEQALLKMADKEFSVICLRQGTVSGYSPRMRLDLIVNTMFKTSVGKKEIVVNNPLIWRPILAIDDAMSAYTRAIEAGQEISGIFNVASGNYTVSEVADIVKYTVEKHFKIEIDLQVKHLPDIRNYKVSIEKAKNVLCFRPEHDVASIVQNLIAHFDDFKDLSNPCYCNINVFKSLRQVVRFEAQ